jgi:hypothetical protein
MRATLPGDSSAGRYTRFSRCSRSRWASAARRQCTPSLAPSSSTRSLYTAEQGLAAFWLPYSWSEQEFLFLRGKFPGFSNVAAYRNDNVLMDRGDGETRLLSTLASSAELFSVLGAAPAFGRGFEKGDDASGAEPIAVLSYGLWQELGGDRKIIGQRLKIDGEPRTVVGVMPAAFWFPDPTVRLWIPQPVNRRAGRATTRSSAASRRTCAWTTWVVRSPSS